MISSESRMREIRTSGLMSGGEETWLRPRLRHRHRAKAAGNSYSLVPTAGRASPRLYKVILHGHLSVLRRRERVTVAQHWPKELQDAMDAAWIGSRASAQVRT